MKSGIYKIRNLVNDKIYVGFTVQLNRRKIRHWKDLKAGVHKNEHLQRAWVQYGNENFTFEIIELCEESELESREHYWCTLLEAHNPIYGYNIRPTHPSGKCRHSDETRQKISEAKKGGKQTKESIEKMLATRKAKGVNKHSEETKEKMRQAALGKKKSPEHVEKMKRRIYSEETRQKMSQSRKKVKQSAESIKKRADKLRGVKKPPEFGKRISATKQLNKLKKMNQ